MQELAVLGANRTNTVADHEAINNEAEAMADEFNRLMTTSTYKGKNIFVSTAASEYVSMGGRNAEMTFGIGTISYTELYGSARTVAGGPSDTVSVNLAHLPSDAVAGHKVASHATHYPIATGEIYEVTALGSYAGGHADDARVQTMFGINGTAADNIAVGTQLTVQAGAGGADNDVQLTSGILMKRVSGTNVLSPTTTRTTPE